jgi:hypothetical protein
MMEELSSSKTLLLTRATWRNIPEDAILHSHHREKPQILYEHTLLDSGLLEALQMHEAIILQLTKLHATKLLSTYMYVSMYVQYIHGFRVCQK